MIFLTWFNGIPKWLKNTVAQTGDIITSHSSRLCLLGLLGQPALEQHLSHPLSFFGQNEHFSIYAKCRKKTFWS